MAGHGWRYTVNVPLWILGKDTEGESVALYRVNVLLQSADSPDLSSKPPFFVLRRYSQFRQLHSELKTAYPDLFKDRSLAPPPKHTLAALGGHAQQKEMLDRRRGELESWLWALLTRSELARSPLLRAFLDLDKAIARAQQQRRAQASGAQQQPASSPLTSPFPGATPTHTQMQHSSLGGSHGHLFAGSSTAPTSVASSEAGDWEAHDHTSLLQHHHGGGGSASSGLGSSSLLNHGHGQGLDATQGGFAGSSSSEAGAGPSSPHHNPRLPPINTSVSPLPMTPMDVASSSSSSLGGAYSNAGAAAAAAVGSSSMRLGLNLEQRSDVRRLVDVLSRRVRQAAEDLGAAVSEVSALQSANAALSEALVAAREELEGKPGGAMEAQLAAERAEVARLKRALAESTAAGEREYLDLEQQLAEAERSRAAACNRASELQAKLQAAGLAPPGSEKESGSEEEEGGRGSGGGSGGEEAAGLGQQLQQLQERVQQQELELERARQQQQQQVEAVPEDGSAGTAAAVTELQEKVQQLDAQLSSAAAATQSAEAEAARLAAALQQQATEAAAAAEQAAAALASEKAAAAAAAAKARGDQLVLAKEVQRLRGELSKANQDKEGQAAELAAAKEGSAAAAAAATTATSKLMLQQQQQRLSRLLS
ncbi:hypothetical protein OEZ86_007846 [Tetradesmus obliquus]|nr:hypothetical protein OEZ86_007846 [Tetradesmus obliquus]